MTESSLDTNNNSLGPLMSKETIPTVMTNLVQSKKDQTPVLNEKCEADQKLEMPKYEKQTRIEMVTSEPFPPPLQIGLSYRIGFTLASMVAGLSSVCIKQLLLPLQISIIAPHSTNTSFAIVSAIGALAGLLAMPVTGALADRTTSRWGRRRPWIAIGMLIGAIGLLIMALATTIPLLVLGEILEQIGVDAVLANVTALIPDQVPEYKRANASALNGMAPIVGGVVGLVLVTTLTDIHHVFQGYILLTIVSLLCVGFFLTVLREHPLNRSQATPFHLGTFFTSFVHPFQSSRDFTYTLFSRLLIFLTFTITGSYLLFYVRSVLHASITVAAHGVTAYQLISTIVLIIVALLAGYFSQRFDRLKPFVCVGALLMALSMFVIILFPTWSALFSAAVLFGGGFGLYLGVDIALAVRVLPNTANGGKDLGIIYTAIFFPLLVTPILGASILNSSANAFALLFTVAAVSSLVAAMLILPIKSVR
jgi:MFS family permease